MLSEDEKAIQFYKRFIEVEEQELEWMYNEDEEYYRDSIEQKEILIKGWRNILKLITKLQKENEELKNKNKYLKSENDAYGNTIVKQDVEIKEKDRQIKTLNHTNKTYKGMLNKQSKQIDLMAFSLADYVMYYEYDKCRNPEMIKQKAKELKKHFETKVKKEQ